MTTQAARYDGVVDTGRYPIGDPASAAYAALVLHCRGQLRAAGVAELPGFLTPAAVSEMIALTGTLAAGAWASDQGHTVYFEPFDDSSGQDHPRALRQHSAKKAIAFDQIAAVLGKRELYRSADPLDALEIAIFEAGDELGWHFDNSEFSVTVMYAPAEAGGHFDYYPALRDEHDQNYPGVRRVLAGDPAGVRRLAGLPGTLAVFRGQHALHRVTPVRGARPRINSVLTYGERPGMKLTELTQQLFYGRTA
jgi:hypothetical protein